MIWRRSSLLHQLRQFSSQSGTKKGGRIPPKAPRARVQVATRKPATPRAPPVEFACPRPVRPGVVSPKRVVPAHIAHPDYAETGHPSSSLLDSILQRVPVQNEEEIEGVRQASRVARHVLDVAGRGVRAGVTSDEIDLIVHEECIKQGVYPSPLNYRHFPKSCCVSVNEVVCHGIPDSRPFELGDIVNVDVTVFKDGFHGDCSEMFCVGEVDEASNRLIRVTYKAWQAALAVCRPGESYSKIGEVIEDITHANGFTTVHDFGGHGIGRQFHMPPEIMHFRNSSRLVMKPGHIFTVEPMINMGRRETLMWDDNWTVTTIDGARSAQFEHTVLITETGVEILTAKTQSSLVQWWERE